MSPGLELQGMLLCLAGAPSTVCYNTSCIHCGIYDHGRCCRNHHLWREAAYLSFALLSVHTTEMGDVTNFWVYVAAA